MSVAIHRCLCRASEVFLVTMRDLFLVAGVLCVALLLHSSPVFSAASYTQRQIDVMRDVDGTGTIDRIAEQEIVIDDNLFKYDRRVTWLDEQGYAAAASSFNVGDRIVYRLTEQGRIDLLWKFGGQLP